MLYWRSLKLGGSSFVIPRFNHTVVLMYRAKHPPLPFPKKVRLTSRKQGGGRAGVCTSWCCDWRRDEGEENTAQESCWTFVLLFPVANVCVRLLLTRHVRHTDERNGERVAELRAQGGRETGGPRGRRLELRAGGRTGEAAGKVRQCVSSCW